MDYQAGPAGAVPDDNDPGSSRSGADQHTQQMPRAVVADPRSTAVLPVVTPGPGAFTAPPAGAFAAGSANTAAALPPAQSQPARRDVQISAGFSGFLLVAAALGLAVSLFALPLLGHDLVFADLRAAAARDSTVSGADSGVGRSVATMWWRFGALGGVGVIGLLVALSVAVVTLRRFWAALAGLAGAAFAAGLLLAAHQTADLASGRIRVRFHRAAVSDFQLGFWLAVGCGVILFLAGLTAASRRRT